MSMELRDGCWIVNVPDGEETNSCDSADEMPALDDVFEDPEAIEDFLADVREAFADYENPGFVVREVDGSWYFSPIATGDRAAARRRPGADPRGDRGAAGAASTTSPRRSSSSSTRSRRSRRDDGEDDGRPGGGVLDRVRRDGRRRRASRRWSPTARSTATDVPWYLRYPECGLADLGWNGEYYSLPDDEFAATVDDAAPCFQELVDSGEADELDLPVELLNPECLLGRNWYTATDDDYLKEFEECAFGLKRLSW